jgi:hypothetical protein
MLIRIMTLGIALLSVFQYLILLSLIQYQLYVFLKEDFATGIFYENEN